MIEQDPSRAKQQTGARNDIALECRRGNYRPHTRLCCVSPPFFNVSNKESAHLQGLFRLPVTTVSAHIGLSYIANITAFQLQLLIECHQQDRAELKNRWLLPEVASKSAGFTSLSIQMWRPN